MTKIMTDTEMETRILDRLSIHMGDGTFSAFAIPTNSPYWEVYKKINAKEWKLIFTTSNPHSLMSK